MKRQKKLIAILILIAVFIIGVGVGIYWTSKSLAIAKHYFSLASTSFEENEANNIYFSLNANLDQRISSLLHFTRYVEHLYADQFLSKTDRNISQVMVVSYGRLGILFETKG